MSASNSLDRVAALVTTVAGKRPWTIQVSRGYNPGEVLIAVLIDMETSIETAGPGLDEVVEATVAQLEQMVRGGR